MAGTDLSIVTDKRLALAEAGGLEEQQMPPAPRGPSGIGNPAPLGLLCFGMTTGESCCPRVYSIRVGWGFGTTHHQLLLAASCLCICKPSGYQLIAQ